MDETRTTEEILSYEDDSIFGFFREVLVEFLSFEEAKPWLKPDATSEGWLGPKPRTLEAAVEEARKYMEEISLDKAVNHRGLSAGRSIEKLRAWCWMAGDDEALRICDEVPYPNYGAPKLLALCEHFGWDWKKMLGNSTDAIEIFEAQANGQICPDCLAGSGSGCGQ